MADRPTPILPGWMNERNIRLGAGVVLFTFVTLHLINAGLLVFGLPAAGALRPVLSAFWEFPPIALCLYTALVVHPLLALKRLALRRTWRMPAAEAWQTVLGLCIPIWLARHAVFIRGTETVTGVSVSYRELLTNFNSMLGFEQAALVIIVWVHGCIGLTMTLRLKPWFARWRMPLLAAAVFVPVFALCGMVAGIREVALAPYNGDVTARNAAFYAQYPVVYSIIMVVFATALATIVLRAILARFEHSVIVRYAEGPVVRGLPGMTLLEISRRNHIPHASVCGGKARCSTCRVRVTQSTVEQPPPNAAERRLLARIGAPPNIRLGCQLKPVGDLGVERLVDAGNARAGIVVHNDPFRWGVERQITVMFADIRSFTSIAEKHFAFDIVFALNRFQADMARAIEINNGRIDKYLGDGLMAIFGIQGGRDAGAADAMRASRAMLENLEALNGEFQTLLGSRLRIGIGLHSGSAILGRIGADASSAGLTALGDTVNVAARLEEMTKTFGAVCVASESTLITAYAQATIGTPHDVAIRGRSQPLAVRSFASLAEMPENATISQRSA